MPVSSKNGWGIQSALLNVAAPIGGVNKVIQNVGAAIQVQAGGSPLRLTKFAYRIDLAPDVAAGSVVAPTRWRVAVIEGQLPQDVSIFQAQAFGAGAHPEIPQAVGNGAPIPMLYDLWLDLAVGDPGLNQLVAIDFADAGPTCGGSEALSVLVCPILDANMNQTIIAASNALITVAAFGTGLTASERGVGGGQGGGDSRSLPRWDARMSGGA